MIMLTIEVQHLQPGMVIFKEVFDPYGNQIATKGTLITERLIQEIHIANVKEVNILDIQKLQKRKNEQIEQSVELKSRINLLFNGTNDTLKQLISFRTYQFHSEVRKFLIPFFVNHADSSAKFKDIEEIITTVLSSPNLIIPIANLLNLSMNSIRHVHVLACALVIGEELNLSREDLCELAKASLFYNMGYCRILSKKQNLDPSKMIHDLEITDEDRKVHMEEGYYSVLQFENERVAAVAYEHHERFNGSGSPRGLTGTEISLFARIVSVARTYVSLQTDRRDREKVSCDKAFDFIAADNGNHFDPEVIKAFTAWFHPYPMGRLVELSDGSIGLVAEQDESDVHSPYVYITNPKVFNFRVGQIIMLRMYPELFIKKIF